MFLFFQIDRPRGSLRSAAELSGKERTLLCPLTLAPHVHSPGWALVMISGPPETHPPRAHSGSTFVTSATTTPPTPPRGPWCRWLGDHLVRCWLQELGLGVRGAQSFRELPDWRCDVPGSAAPEGLHLGQQWGGPQGSCRCGKGCGSGAPWAGSAERRSAGPAQEPGPSCSLRGAGV